MLPLSLPPLLFPLVLSVVILVPPHARPGMPLLSTSLTFRSSETDLRLIIRNLDPTRRTQLASGLQGPGDSYQLELLTRPISPLLRSPYFTSIPCYPLEVTGCILTRITDSYTQCNS